MSRARQKPTILGVCKHELKETQTSNSKTKCMQMSELCYNFPKLLRVYKYVKIKI